MKIKTEHVFPPIPLRQFDWMAWDDDLGEDGSPLGFGPTESQAIDDLLERGDERADE